MKKFSVRIQDSTDFLQHDDVVGFVGADASGQFGLQAGAEKTIVALQYGLARFTCENGKVVYLAIPSGILQFDGILLTITTTHFMAGENRDAMADALASAIAAQEKDAMSARKVIVDIEHALLKKLLDMRQQHGMEIPL